MHMANCEYLLLLISYEMNADQSLFVVDLNERRSNRTNLVWSISDKRQKQSTIGRIILQLHSSFCYFRLQTKKSVTSFFFGQIFMIFYLNVGHYMWVQKKCMALEKKGMAPCHAKTG